MFELEDLTILFRVQNVDKVKRQYTWYLKEVVGWSLENGLSRYKSDEDGVGGDAEKVLEMQKGEEDGKGKRNRNEYRRKNSRK
tara:strand:- start:51 stop:299 length:249 start_codon:yes stop_codon:yes gene_type:complete